MMDPYRFVLLIISIIFIVCSVNIHAVRRQYTVLPADTHYMTCTIIKLYIIDNPCALGSVYHDHNTNFNTVTDVLFIAT